LKFAWRLDEILFSQTRYINAFTDFAHFDSTGKRIQWTYRLPGNRLNIYEELGNRGVYPFLENGVQNLRIEASDVAGNTSVLRVLLYVDDQKQPTEEGRLVIENIEPGRLFSHAVSNTFETDEVRVVIPAMALYAPIQFTYTVEPSFDPNIFSNVHHVHHSGTPVHTNYLLQIKPTDLPESLENKALIASWDSRKNEWVAEGGRFNNGFVSHNIRKFSIFAVAIDTVPPTIRPMNIRNNTVPATQNVLTFQIDDDFSGIGGYEARINDRWFLMEHDPKTRTLSGTIDFELPRGENEFRLTVNDRMNNRTTYRATIIR